MNRIRVKYYEGEVVEKDFEKAAKWFRKAADAGNAIAQYNLGNLYYNGEGVEKDFVEAAKWFRLAADAGNANAQTAMGSMYYKGEGVTKSIDDAKYWWQKAADQGNEMAKESLKLVNKAVASSANKFSVSPTKKVRFAKGNLQYNAATKKWRFAEHQWDYIGYANKNISPNYNGWIDLFGWGTGLNPTKTSENYHDYSLFFDWGLAIMSGNNNWRTLKAVEWEYVIDKRNTQSGIRYAKAIVNNVCGVILLPDNWKKSYYNLKNTNTAKSFFSSNRVSKSEWNEHFEVNGAIFLPAAGCRWGVDLRGIGSQGHYYSSSFESVGTAYSMGFHDDYGGIFHSNVWCNPVFGNSVRLVCDCK